MRKIIALSALMTLAFMLIGNVTLLSVPQFDADQLAAWQTVAETYYVENVDENFLLNELDSMTHSWGYANPDLIQPGMIAPDFELMTLDGTPISLSQFKGNAFVVVISGSWY